MKKILTSFRYRPINICLIFIVVILYFLNNFYFKKYASEIIRFFFVCYFNDFICPLFFVSYSNFLLIIVHKEIQKLYHILLLCFSAGCFWEFGAPLLKETAVTDLWDIVFYLLGGLLYWFCLKLSIRRR